MRHNASCVVVFVVVELEFVTLAEGHDQISPALETREANEQFSFNRVIKNIIKSSVSKSGNNPRRVGKVMRGSTTHLVNTD